MPPLRPHSHSHHLPARRPPAVPTPQDCSLNNRRLYVLKWARAEGLLPGVRVGVRVKPMEQTSRHAAKYGPRPRRPMTIPQSSVKGRFDGVDECAGTVRHTHTCVGGQGLQP